MRLLDRYVAREILLPFVAALGFLFVLLFAMQLLRGIEVVLGSGVRATDVLRMLAYMAPHFLAMAMPVSFLLAVMLGIGRLSEDRETVALAASGIAPNRLWMAPLAAALAVAFFAVLLGQSLEPRGLASLRQLVQELIKRNIAGDVKPGQFYSALADMTLYTQAVDGKTRRFTNVLIADERDADAPLLMLARSGEVDPSAAERAVRLNLADGEIHRSSSATDDYAVVTFEKASMAVAVDLRTAGKFGGSREEMTPDELVEAAEAARAEGREQDARRYQTAWERRIASPLATVVFALCGVPLALGRRRGARAMGAVVTLLTYIAYYVVARGGEVLAEGGRVSPVLGAQLPTLGFLVLAVLLMRRATRAGA